MTITGMEGSRLEHIDQKSFPDRHDRQPLAGFGLLKCKGSDPPRRSRARLRLRASVVHLAQPSRKLPRPRLALPPKKKEENSCSELRGHSISVLYRMNGNFVPLRVPCPTRFFAKNVDGRVDAKGSWKGKGFRLTSPVQAPKNIEVGRERRARWVKF